MTVHDIPVNSLAGQPSSLGELSGKTLLVVNVASKCGLTRPGSIVVTRWLIGP